MAEKLSDKSVLLIAWIDHLFSNLRGDWSDNRHWCRQGWEAVSRLRELNEIVPPPAAAIDQKPYRYDTELNDEQYYDMIREELKPKTTDGGD